MSFMGACFDFEIFEICFGHMNFEGMFALQEDSMMKRKIVSIFYPLFVCLMLHAFLVKKEVK